MRRINLTSARLASRNVRARSSRPEAEALEGRILLYSTLGQWTYSSRITYSFMPDGTNVGGVSSVLFQTMNASYPTAEWQGQIEQAATLWEANAHLNLALVPDGGEAVGTSGDQQDDPRFGDIRIGAVPLASGVLAETFLPPPSNGGTDAGDILFNSNIQWQIGTGYDLATVAAHEFGHALGLGESTVSSAVMYGTYNGIKTALVSDDISGIQSLYTAPQYDQFNTGTHNSSVLTATNITSYIGSNGQIALPGLDITLPTQAEYYVVTVPATNSGQMVVTVQSSNLSSLAPTMYVYNSSLSQVATASLPNTYGATIWTSNAVTAGQKYYIKVASSGSYGRVGAYGLEVNFGSQSQPPIQPPNTVVAQQPDQGGGSINNAITATSDETSPGGSVGVGLGTPGVTWATIGSLSGWAAELTTSEVSAAPVAGSPPSVTISPTQSPVIAAPIGTVPVAAPVPVVVSPTAGSQAGPPSGSITPTPTGHRNHKKAAHHAVDATLSAWTGHRSRPHVTSKVRAIMHGLDHVS